LLLERVREQRLSAKINMLTNFLLDSRKLCTFSGNSTVRQNHYALRQYLIFTALSSGAIC
jgi:hypothetical protein